MIANSKNNNKIIAKNTIYLYVRMLLTMLVQLYTSRVVLAMIGVEDYGIYNIVGGVVVLFSFMQHAMSNSTQRFLSYELGKGDMTQMRRVFNMSITCHFCIALVVLVLAETIGLWLVETQLVIPIEREKAASWVYQISIATFIINIMRIPYNAIIISYEKMSFYAYISIFEVLLKLGVVYLLTISFFDKLILYSVLILLSTLLCLVIYIYYCRKRFDVKKYTFFVDKPLFKKMMSFSGWSMLGSGSVLITQQGGNIILNSFVGVVANAAYGIANQVSSAIFGFVSNFQLAFQPQITKQYASGDRTSCYKLSFKSALVSYYLMLIIAVPFCIETNWIFTLWLGDNIPMYSVIFCRLMMCYYLIDAIQAPLWMLINATGRNKAYSIWSSSLSVLTLPISICLFKMGFPIYYFFIVRVVVNLLIAFIRVLYMKALMDFPRKEYCLSVVCPVIITTMVSGLLSFFVAELVQNSVLTIILSIFIVALCVFILGISNEDRKLLRRFINNTVRQCSSI